MERSNPITHLTPERSGPLEQLLIWSAKLPRTAATAYLAVMWIAVLGADAGTGRHVSLNGFYLVPLCLTAWCLGYIPALACGGVATVATLLLNGFGDGLSAQASTVSPAVAAWNAGMRFFAVVFIIMLVGAFRRVFDRERADARVDHLTNLGNRRAFEIESRRLAEACVRDRRVLLCGMIDVDGFKHVNDCFGHSAGDEVLKAIAAALAGAVRSYDATARIGGDEFAFCLAVRDVEAARRITETIYKTISLALERTTWPVSCSIGAATGVDANQTLLWADELLYDVKESGKAAWRFQSEDFRIGQTLEAFVATGVDCHLEVC